MLHIYSLTLVHWEVLTSRIAVCPFQKNDMIVVRRKDVIFLVFNRTYPVGSQPFHARAHKLAHLIFHLFFFHCLSLRWNPGNVFSLLLWLFANHTKVLSTVLSLHVTRRGVGVNLSCALTCIMNTMITWVESSLKFALSSDQLIEMSQSLQTK